MKPLKMVRGQGLCKWISGIEAVVIKPDSAPGSGQGSEPPISQCDWYKDIFSILSLVSSL